MLCEKDDLLSEGVVAGRKTRKIAIPQSPVSCTIEYSRVAIEHATDLQRGERAEALEACGAVRGNAVVVWGHTDVEAVE